MTNLDSILKSRDITLPTMVHLVKAMVFLVVMYGCESWTIKKAEHRRIDAVELWCWRRLLTVPWTARRSYQSILKEISPGCSLEGLMLKLKLQLLWPPDVKSWLIGKDPDAGKYWGQKEKGMTENEMVGWHHWLNGHGSEWPPGVGDGQGGRAYCSSWSHRARHDWATELNWTELSSKIKYLSLHFGLSHIYGLHISQLYFLLKIGNKIINYITFYALSRNFTGCSDGKNVCLQWRSPRFDLWVENSPWSRKWQPTLVRLPGQFHLWRYVVGYSPWVLRELDITERLHFQFISML